MCSRKERKGWHSARNTETFVAAGRRGGYWAWTVASPCEHGMRRPMPRDASIAAASKGHGSPAAQGHKIRRGAPARKSRTPFREGRNPFPCRACGPFRVRQGVRHEVRSAGTAHGGNLFTVMTPWPCRDCRRRSFAEVGFRVHARSALCVSLPVMWLSDFCMKGVKETVSYWGMIRIAGEMVSHPLSAWETSG